MEGGAGAARWTRSKGPVECDHAAVLVAGHEGKKKKQEATLDLSDTTPLRVAESVPEKEIAVCHEYDNDEPEMASQQINMTEILQTLTAHLSLTFQIQFFK
ncbi:unnamed protein product [Linum trigynum]|uniref:Uncharacterized protein n=1 Tax=Linum trigynum TaxID=586398 RepID=A0AAV2F6B9_9ROSI